MILKKKYKSNISGILNICYDSTKKAWVFKKSINKVKYKKRFYGKKINKNLLKQAIKYKLEYENMEIAWCLVEKFNTIPLNKNHIFFFLQNPDLYQYFTITIDEILFFCEQLQLSDDNKALIKYQKIKKEINESLDPNKYVKDLAVKYSKYNFKLVLYLEKLELLVPISKLEIYFCQLANLIKDKKDIKILKP
ncbi:37524_t:CDS:2, partial [Gigaspora margarita]